MMLSKIVVRKTPLYHPYSGCGSSFGLVMHQYVLLLNILENLKLNLWYKPVNSDSLILMHTTQVQYSGTRYQREFSIRYRDYVTLASLDEKYH